MLGIIFGWIDALMVFLYMDMPFPCTGSSLFVFSFSKTLIRLLIRLNVSHTVFGQLITIMHKNTNTSHSAKKNPLNMVKKHTHAQGRTNDFIIVTVHIKHIICNICIKYNINLKLSVVNLYNFVILVPDTTIKI